MTQVSSERDALFMAAARAIAKQSLDTTKVGCVIVDAQGTIRASGFNDLPRGVRDLPERRARPAKYSWVTHAERKAVYGAARKGVALEGCTMYMPWFPCSGCAQAIIDAGIVELVAIEPDVSDPRWGEDFRISLSMFEDARVKVRYVNEAAVERG